ncbi:DUF4429 domain-containing protein [Streptomyces sp. NBC_00370]|uniref:DUF4429 domain-containing protein n=1 Tax=Streptomyces sp. NBC_00370 TaxID=2975728 RepID=UPI002E265A30
MAEIIQKDGTWAFDGDTVRIVPGHDKGVGLLRSTLGEVAVPLEALAGIAFESGRRSGRLRLRLRDGADPLLQVTGGKLDDASDPYRLTVESDRSGVAEYIVDEVRTALLLDGVESGPVDRYLLPGPALPLTVGAGDATVTFDGERVRLEWNWKTEDSKSSGGPRTIEIGDLDSVEWLPSAGLDNGYLRFRVAGAAPSATPPKHDPYAAELWGFKKDPLMALVGAAVVARLPHPRAARPPAALDSGEQPVDTVKEPSAGDHDALLRRLRELGELHQAGILTADEFTTAKQALLRHL